MHTAHKKNRQVLACMLVTSLTASLLVGNAHSRMTEWTSSEWIYTPERTVIQDSYVSDLLVSGGQKILLSDWYASEETRVVTIRAFTNEKDPAEPSVVRKMVRTMPEEEENREPSEDLPQEDVEETVPDDGNEAEILEPEPPETEGEMENEPTTGDPADDSEDENDRDPENEDPTLDPEPDVGEDAETEEPGMPPFEGEPEDNPESGDDTDDPEQGEIPDEEEPEEDIPQEPVVIIRGDVTVTLDVLAATYMNCIVDVSESHITLQLTRMQSVAEKTEVTIHIGWQGLEGTVCVALCPEEKMDDNGGSWSDADLVVSSGALSFDNPIGYLMLNLQPMETYQIILEQDEVLYKVRYSLDGGKTYTLLYDSYIMSLTVPESDWNGLVILDFTHALTDDSMAIVRVCGGGYEDTCYFAFPAHDAVGPMMLTTAELPYVIPVQTEWGDASLQLRVQKLNQNTQIYVATNSLIAMATNGSVTLRSNGEPEAGSYRLVLQWYWQGILVEERSVEFFINTQ